MDEKRILMVIDPQVDFVEGGHLAVPGGEKAMDGLADVISRAGDRIYDIVVTYDSHHPMHIAHPVYYILSNGELPKPFSRVENRDGVLTFLEMDSSTGEFHEYATGNCRAHGLQQWTLDYLLKLESTGRYPHMIWPPHCLIGNVGACAVPSMAKAICNWEESQCAVAHKVTKGSNIKTEHFGALRAEVFDPDDVEGTGVNTSFLKILEDGDTTIFGCGLALSHCLANTARDTADEFDGDTFVERFVLIEDATASVTGLEFLGEQFVEDFKKRGMRTIRLADF